MKNHHVLLADDDQNTLETMGTILEMDGFQVSSALSGVGALEQLAKSEQGFNQIDILIIDLDMNNLSGIELLIELGKRGYTQPVMVVTGFASKATVVELMRKGVCDFLDKPIHMEEFRKRVNRISKAILHHKKEPTKPFRVLIEENSSCISFIDPAKLGSNYTLCKTGDPAIPSSLALVNQTNNGYDILLARVIGNDSEGFYLSSCIKPFFEKFKNLGLTGNEFLSKLSERIESLSLVFHEVQALHLQVILNQKRIILTPSGFNAELFFGQGFSQPRSMAVSGKSLGIGMSKERNQCILPFEPGSRLFVFAKHEKDDLNLDMPLELGSTKVDLGRIASASDSLFEVSSAIWQYFAEGEKKGKPSEALLLGLENP